MDEDQGSPIGSLMVSNLMECNFVVDIYFMMSIFKCKTVCQFLFVNF